MGQQPSEIDGILSTGSLGYTRVFLDIRFRVQHGFFSGSARLFSGWLRLRVFWI